MFTEILKVAKNFVLAEVTMFISVTSKSNLKISGNSFAMLTRLGICKQPLWLADNLVMTSVPNILMWAKINRPL